MYKRRMPGVIAGEEKKAAARGTAPAPKKRTKAEQARWEQMELEAQAAAAKRQENISRIVGVAIFALSVIFSSLR